MVDNPFRLDGRVALVFGAGASGPGVSNGLAAAIAYARAGAKVACVDVAPDAAEAAARAVREAGGQALTLTADVTAEADVAAAVAATLQAFGTLDILHNNVGHTRMGGPVELTPEEWRREIDLNLTGVYLACRHALPVMIAGGGGVVTNISSIGSIRHLGYPYASYAAAKAAVNQLTISVALDNADKGIRCNAILPGFIDTPLARAQIGARYASHEEAVAARAAAVPMKRLGTPWDVANAAVFLASGAAAYITGTLMVVDGGLTAKSL